jgi:hypothetical protein
MSSPIHPIQNIAMLKSISREKKKKKKVHSCAVKVQDQGNKSPNERVVEIIEGRSKAHEYYNA